MAQQKNLEVVYGVHPVTELIKAKKRKVSVVYTTKPSPKAFNIIQGQLPSYIEVRFVSKQHLEKLCGTPDHQGIVALATPIQIRKKFFDPKKQPLLVLLDGIQDPQNLGAIIRSAETLGIQGLILPKHGSPDLNETVAKCSSGALEHLPITWVTNLNHCIEKLKESGFWVAGVVPDGEMPCYQYKFNAPSALVIGGEEKGIRPLLKKSCDVTLAIPMNGKLQSLNAASASTVIFYENLRQKLLLNTA